MMIRELNNPFFNNLRYAARFDGFIAFDVYCGVIEDASSIISGVISTETATFDAGDVLYCWSCQFFERLSHTVVFTATCRQTHFERFLKDSVQLPWAFWKTETRLLLWMFRNSIYVCLSVFENTWMNIYRCFMVTHDGPNIVILDRKYD